MNLRTIAHAIGGEVLNGQVLAPGPNHSRADRSLAVRLSAGSPYGFIVFSHSGDDWRDCMDYVRQRLGIARQQHARKPQERPRVTVADDAEKRSRDMARALVRESVDARGTPAEIYLRDERKLPDALHDGFSYLTLRFHPECPFKDDGKLVFAPAIICAVRSAREIMGACQRLGDPDKVAPEILRDHSFVLACQRIRLTGDGKKLERRSLGPMGDDGCVFIGSPFEAFYGAGATITEGVETALAMKALGYDGCVALTGSSRFRTFAPPLHWGRIVIAAENDAGASESAWRDAGARWANEDRRHVEIIAPADARYKDANDILMEALP